MQRTRARTATAGSAAWSRSKVALVAAGMVLAVAGVLVGVVGNGPREFFVGLPLVTVGLGLTGAGIVLQGAPFRLFLRAWGWLLLLAAAALAVLFVRLFRL